GEHDETRVGTDRELARSSGVADAGGIDAHALDLSRLEVAEVNVGRRVVVARDEVRRVGLEGDVAAVGGDRGRTRGGVRGLARAVHADALGTARFAGDGFVGRVGRSDVLF